MRVTFYKPPFGRTQEIDCKNVRPEDETWFKEHGVAISMEDVGGDFAVYADLGRSEEEGGELLVLSRGRSCEDTLAALRADCEKELLVSVIKEETQEVLFRGFTVGDAEAFIQGLMATDPEGVEAGHYGIDAPEHLVNPT